MITLERARITRILTGCRAEVLREWVRVIEEMHRVNRVRQPQRTLVMAKARDSATSQPFFLGELLATECTVDVDGSIGFGLVLGDRSERAYDMAVIDAAFNGRLPELDDIIPGMIDEERKIDEREKKEFSYVERTKVDFETMGDVNG